MLCLFGFALASQAIGQVHGGFSASATMRATATVVSPLGVISGPSETLSLMGAPGNSLSISIYSETLDRSIEVQPSEIPDDPQKLREFTLEACMAEMAIHNAECFTLTIIYTEN